MQTKNGISHCKYGAMINLCPFAKISDARTEEEECNNKKCLIF